MTAVDLPPASGDDLRAVGDAARSASDASQPAGNIPGRPASDGPGLLSGSAAAGRSSSDLEFSGPIAGASSPDLDLAHGDDALIAAQRLAEWTSRAPELEEDVALANIALDLLGQARMFLSRAGQALGKTEDELAFLRDDRGFRNVQLVELPNGDFAHTMIRMLFFSAYQRELFASMAGDLIADKATKEVAYHVDHARLWTLRLGDGTEESHDRAQRAVEELWPYTHELFEAPVPGTSQEASEFGGGPATPRAAGDQEAGGFGEAAGDRADGTPVGVSPLRAGWLRIVEPILAEATLTIPVEKNPWAPTGGRRGIHTEHLSYLLAEMQSVHRAHPGASW